MLRQLLNVVGEAFFFHDRDWRTSRQRHKAHIQIDFFPDRDERSPLIYTANLFDSLLLIEEVNDFGTQAVIAGMFYHVHVLVRARNIHIEDATNVSTGTVGQHDNAIAQQHRLVPIMGDHNGGEGDDIQELLRCWMVNRSLINLPVDGTTNGRALVPSAPYNLMLNGSHSAKRISVFYKILPLI